MSDPRRRRRVLRDTRDKLRKLPFAGFKQLAAQRDKLVAAIKARIKDITRNLNKPEHRVVPRSEWGARPAKSVSHMSSDSSGVFIHHSVGAMPTSEGGERTEMRAIQRFHTDSRDYYDIGYSFVVAPSGRVYEGRGLNVAGAHTEGYNSTAYGVCFMGNFENAQPTDASLAAAHWLRRDYLRLADRPLRGHRDVNQTACPGRNLYNVKGQI